MGKGNSYEHTLTNEIQARSSQAVFAGRIDYSGNSKYGFADIAVIWSNYNDLHTSGAFLEAKKRSAEAGKRTNVASVEEVESLVDGCPTWGRPYLAVKFPNRELIILNARTLLLKLDDREVISGQVGAPKRTRGDNISMRKPELDDWPSAQSGADDVEKIFDYCGVSRKYWDTNV